MVGLLLLLCFVPAPYEHLLKCFLNCCSRGGVKTAVSLLSRSVTTLVTPFFFSAAAQASTTSTPMGPSPATPPGLDDP